MGLIVPHPQLEETSVTVRVCRQESPMEIEHNNRFSVDDVMNLSRGGHSKSFDNAIGHFFLMAKVCIISQFKWYFYICHTLVTSLGYH